MESSALVTSGPQPSPCVVCGKGVSPGDRFCSRQCWGAYRTATASKTRKACCECGKPIGRQAVRCCSNKCYGQYRTRNFTGAANQNWKGGKTTGSARRAQIIVASGQPGRRTRYRYEYIVVAERALGHALPSGAVVHHVNGDRFDNRPGNLVICPSHSYHRFLHIRAKKLRAA